MRIRRTAITLIIILSGLILKGQDTWYGTMSGMHVMYNPAYAGSSGVPSLQLSCYSFLPGNGFGLQSVYGSFDGFFESLHGGAGLWISDDMLGDVMNDFRSGAAYAYHLRAGNDLFFNAGLAASVIHRGIKRDAIILPDDIDPFSGPAGSSEYIDGGNVTLFDLGTGIAFSRRPYYGGFSVMHLTQPWLSGDHKNTGRLRRLYTLNTGAFFRLWQSGIMLNTSAALMAQADTYTFYLGTEAIWRSILCGLAFWHINSGFISAEPSLGWDSGSTKLIISYSYILDGGDTAFKGTAIVRAGVSVSFNNVEKSRAVHIIKLPSL